MSGITQLLENGEVLAGRIARFVKSYRDISDYFSRRSAKANKILKWFGASADQSSKIGDSRMI
jgi:hypothetical protein